MGAGRKRGRHAAKRGKIQLVELGVALCAFVAFTTLAFEVIIPWIPIEWVWRFPQVLFPIAVILVRGDTLRDLGLTGGGAATRNVGLGILAGVPLAAALVPFIHVGLWSPETPEMLSWDTFSYGIFTILINVVSIEIFYRGYMQPRFEPVVGFAPGLVATSLLCGLDFWEPKVLSPAPVVIAALVFGFLFKRTRSLLTPIIAHFMFILLIIATHIFIF